MAKNSKDIRPKQGGREINGEWSEKGPGRLGNGPAERKMEGYAGPRGRVPVQCLQAGRDRRRLADAQSPAPRRSRRTRR